MKILGLVTEYNPFHNGHLYHLNKSKEITGATHTVAVMSGNFLQRGEPALINKWCRAKMAVRSGVDLVIELPTAYASSTAELFAFGSISLLHNLDIIDCISFGSEHGDIDALKIIADILSTSPPRFNDYLKVHLKSGVPFPVARTQALIDFLKMSSLSNKDKSLVDIEPIMNNPNNILSIEYLKMLKKLKSNIVPYTLARIKAAYHSTEINSSISSATAIREHLKSNKSLEDLIKVMPLSSYDILAASYQDNIAPVFKEDFSNTIMTILRRESPSSLTKYFDVNEGLENKIYQCGLTCNSINELYHCIKSKRYPLTRIQRICIHLLLNLKKDDLMEFTSEGGPQYIRVLAFNDKGREILKWCKSQSKLPIINKINQYIPQNSTAEKLLNLDIRATNIYTLGINNPNYACKPLDFYLSPYYYKE
ncbi:Predicted nucleotidyltransferase [Natronincola peptidivorans]|uniref:tRNA(Met) cytidine acetate ligase n=1 Tax=Natronincola peptidivorans TaxID=426128 RepID=A0A1H9YDG5_9FIRM|nr:nucleotidyltransferase [Natronincola peptidivorans]SES66515.1 Predicted nucleotidyltransferase [Natronincola peptidivorans]